MLKTNSKQAIANIRAYILENYCPESYGPEAEKETFEEIAKFILDTAQKEKSYLVGRKSLFFIFDDWSRGLPSLFNTCYFYNRSAIDDLGDLLEENETERNKYSETDAENLLTKLIFRELEKVYR